MIRTLAATYSPEAAKTLREIADELDAEAEREEQAAAATDAPQPPAAPLAS